MRATRSFLGKALVVAEIAGGKITPATLSAVTAAAACGPVTALVAGQGVKEAAGLLSNVRGVADVLAVDHAVYAAGLPEEVAALVAEVAREGAFTHVVAGTSAFGKGVVPRAAAMLDSMPIVDITAVESEDTFVRLAYAGNAVTKVRSSDSVKCITARPTNFDRAPLEGGAAAVAEGKAAAEVGKSTWVEDIVSASDTPDLATARVVVSGGRGLKNKANFELLFKLAAPMKAAVGATRAVVDAGDAPNEMQVGQTGKVVAPQLYFAVGLSGAIQHVAGMKDSKTIVAINTDADAPIFQVADYGLVEDLFKAVPELTKAIE